MRWPLVTTHQDVNGSQLTYRQKLHVLELDNLTEPISPVVLTNGTPTNFNPQYNEQRAGLTVTDASR